MLQMNPMNLMEQQLIQRMQSSNPALFNRVMQMTQGKSPQEIQQIALNVARERGIDLNKFASQYGIKV